MRKSILLIAFVALQLWALDKTLITVTASSVNNGVVIVDVRESAKSYELQCNKSATSCNIPEPGSYWMVRLPKNHGMYDCNNVDLYPQSVDPERGEKLLGEYCLNEK